MAISTKALKAGAEVAEEARLEKGRRRNRLYGIVGGIAAALIVVVALGATLNTSVGSKDQASTAGAGNDQAPGASPTSSRAESAAGGASKELDDLPLRSSYSSVESLTEDVSTRREAFSSKAADAANEFGSSDGAPQSATVGGWTAGETACAAVAQKMDPAARQLARGRTTIAGTPVSAFLYLSADGRTLYFFNADCGLVNRQRLG